MKDWQSKRQVLRDKKDLPRETEILPTANWPELPDYYVAHVDRQARVTEWVNRQPYRYGMEIDAELARREKRRQTSLSRD